MSSPPRAAGAPTDRLGRPLRDLRLSVTDRCNFRCPYCMPAELFGEDYGFLPRQALLRFEELERLTRIFVELGVRKVRITGGEPLMRKQLPALVARLAAIDPELDLALTTNGARLAEHARALADAGLKRVTVSLDSLDDEVFRRMNGGRGDPAPVLAGIEAAERAGLRPIKINCVVQRGANDHTLVALARRFRGTGHVVRFIEYMDVGTLNDWRLDHVVPAREIVARVAAELPLRPAAPRYRGEVARRWLYADGSGEIGVISSVSQPFCADCTRARLSSEGRLLTCLFAGDADGVDLRTPLRSGAGDDALRELIEGTWAARRDRYSEERGELLKLDGAKAGRERVEMYRIGG